MATRELLSVHKTVATFDGLTEQQCLFRTALCPNECGHGGTTATFSIKKVCSYKLYMYKLYKLYIILLILISLTPW